jgi:hypothetical protein
MKLFDTIKQFKNITPDAEFTQRSRTEILLSPQAGSKTPRGVFAFLHILETGAAVALTAFFILIMTASFPLTSPISHSIAPIQYSVIDPAGLHAEAQAIDMQIDLADINYPQTTSGAGSTAASAIVAQSLSKALAVAPASSASTTPTSSVVTTSASTSTASSSLSVDQALEQLSQ